MGTRKWQFRFDSDGQTIRGEQREYSARKQQGRARNDNYRSNRQHPNFAEEQAKGQALLDAWAESLNNDKDKPRSR